jgi:hypothetical protein
MEIKRLLKYFAKHGYPSPETLKIMEYSGYDHYEFLGELVHELGHDKATKFVDKTLHKLSSTPEISIKVDLSEQVSDGSWIYLNIHDFEIDLESEASDVLINWSWGDNVIVDYETGLETTLGNIADEVGMGDWSDYDDFVDSLRDTCYKHIVRNCGFGIWFN